VVDPARERALSDPARGSTGAERASIDGGLARALAIPADLEASIVLLRHGESVHITEGRFQGRADSPLSALGERQAVAAAARLADPARPPALPIQSRAPLEIVHSPLRRAATTATLAAEAIGAARGSLPPLRPEPGIIEIGQGSWEGRERTDIETNEGELLAAWRRDPLASNAPGGERVLDAAERARTALAVVLAGLAAANAVGPARPPAGIPGSSSVPGYPGAAPSDAPWTLLVGHDGIFKVVLLTLLGLPLERFWVFPFALCGLTVVELRDGRGILRAHNLAEHLAAVTGAASPPAAAPTDTGGGL
jgi:phosphoserine phosphatase